MTSSVHRSTRSSAGVLEQRREFGPLPSRRVPNEHEVGFPITRWGRATAGGHVRGSAACGGASASLLLQLELGLVQDAGVRVAERVGGLVLGVRLVELAPGQ